MRLRPSAISSRSKIARGATSPRGRRTSTSIILTNGETYGGGGLYNVFSTAAAGNDFAEYLFIHEFGHHFAGLADEYYTSPVAYEKPERVFEPWAANATATTDPARLKWRDLLAPGVPLPTPWPKQQFEAMQKEYQATRAKLRADKRPEAEMTQLFRREAELEMKLFADGGAQGEGRPVPGRQLRRAGVLPSRDRLHHVLAQRGPVLQGVPAGAVAADRSARVISLTATEGPSRDGPSVPRRASAQRRRPRRRPGRSARSARRGASRRGRSATTRCCR